MEDVVDAMHRILHAARVAHVADVVLYLVAPVMAAHVILLLLIPREDADFPDIRREEPPQHRIAERPRAARNQQHFF